jgi:hypothetical protein
MLLKVSVSNLKFWKSNPKSEHQQKKSIEYIYIRNPTNYVNFMYCVSILFFLMAFLNGNMESGIEETLI